MQEYEVISVRTSGQSMFVNVKLDGQELKPSPSCHAKFSAKPYKIIQDDDLQEGDVIKLETVVNGNFINITEYGGRVSEGTSAPSAASSVSKSGNGGGNSNYRHPDELVMHDCILHAVQLASTPHANFPAKIKFGALQSEIMLAAMEFYKLVKDPDKNMMLSSDSSDVQEESPEIEQKPLPDKVEA